MDIVDIVFSYLFLNKYFLYISVVRIFGCYFIFLGEVVDCIMFYI